MKQSFILLSIVAVFSAADCASVVRDAGVYRNEIGFMSAAATQLAQGQLLHAAARAREGDQEECRTLAKDALVISLRVPFHAAKMMFLGGLGPDPGEPPPIPTVDGWCLERAAKVETSSLSLQLTHDRAMTLAVNRLLLEEEARLHEVRVMTPAQPRKTIAHGATP